MIMSGAIKRDTQVWKAGMSGWASADSISELSTLFNNAPPPLS